MSKKGGGAGDGKITPKNPSLRMRPRGGFWGGGGGGGKSWFWGILGIQGFGDVGLPQEVARENWILSKQTLLRSNETSCQETNQLKILICVVDTNN